MQLAFGCTNISEVKSTVYTLAAHQVVDHSLQVVVHGIMETMQARRPKKHRIGFDVTEITRLILG